MLFQDLPNAMSAADITEKLGLHNLRNRNWYIQATCATSGDGLYEGLDWLSNQLKNAKWWITSLLCVISVCSVIGDSTGLIVLSSFPSFIWSIGPLASAPLYLCTVWIYWEECIWMCVCVRVYVYDLSGSSPAVPWTQLTQTPHHSNASTSRGFWCSEWHGMLSPACYLSKMLSWGKLKYICNWH